MAGDTKDDETSLNQPRRQPNANGSPQQIRRTTNNKHQNKKKNRPQWKEAVAGAIAGACSRTVMAPVERVKLLLQLQGSVAKEEILVTTAQPTTKTRTATVSSALSSTRSSSSAWQVARTVYTEQGLRAFWRGNLPNVMRVSGTAAINFTCLDYYKRVLVTPLLERTLSKQQQGNITDEQTRKLSFQASFIAGGLAGATSTTVLYPLEFVRTRLAMDGGASSNRRTFRGMWHTLLTIGRTDGIAGFFQGYGIALTGGVVYRVLYLGGYDAFKGEIMHRRKMKQLNEMGQKESATAIEPSLTWVERFATAQFISLTAGTLSYPFDSVRRRMMMQAGQPVEERKYRNSIHCIRTVLRTEGYRGFFLGLGPNILRSLGGTLLLVGYDRIRTLL